METTTSLTEYRNGLPMEVNDGVQSVPEGVVTRSFFFSFFLSLRHCYSTLYVVGIIVCTTYCTGNVLITASRTIQMAVDENNISHLSSLTVCPLVCTLACRHTFQCQLMKLMDSIEENSGDSN